VPRGTRDASDTVLASARFFWSGDGVLVVVFLAGLWSGAPASTAVSAAGMPPDDRVGPLAEAAAAARARYNEGDFDGALASADVVDATFRGAAAFAADEPAWLVWCDARMTRAMSLRRLGRDADADATLLDLVAVRPSYAPDKGFVPPKVVARFEELRDGLIAGPTRPLTIVIDGGGGVVLDGRARDPGTVDVLPGTHFVGVSGGGAPRGEIVSVTEARTVRLAGVAGAPVVAAVDDRPAGGDGSADAAAVDAGPPWLWLGVGAGALAAVATAVVVAVVVQGREDPAGNPGGVTVAVDMSRLDPP